jgi:hypothetical protein
VISEFDVLYLRHVLNEAVKKRPKNEKRENGDQQDQPISIEANGDTGELSIKGDPNNEFLLMAAMSIANIQIPSLFVAGTVDGKPWSGASNRQGLFDEIFVKTGTGDGDDPEVDRGNGPEESEEKKEPISKAKPEEFPKTCFVRVPRGLGDMTIQSNSLIQHIQVGSGPKLFGTSIRVTKLEPAPLELTFYRYRPTTLRISLVDAAGNPVELKEDKLPEGVTVTTKYTREADVRQAGGNFESSEELMSRDTWKNSVLHFVLPGEEIEVAVIDGKTITVRPFILKDGETRTAQVTLGPKPNWTESSKPTPKVEIKP